MNDSNHGGIVVALCLTAVAIALILSIAVFESHKTKWLLTNGYEQVQKQGSVYCLWQKK